MSFIRLSDDSNPTADYHLRERLQKLETFYKEVAQLTFDHDVIYFGTAEDGNEEESAVVYPSKLGKALEKVDPEWYKNA
jgi:hypothetical protein